MDPDRYWVASAGPEVEIKIKGSRFLGQVFVAASLEEAKDRVAALGKTTHDATHHCWAARVGAPGRVETRSEDDGEPSGTAGVPILQQLERGDWHNALVVVTRYYGGTKLGTGGLAKAYGEAASRALEAAHPEEQFLSRKLRVEVPFNDLGAVETLLAKSSQALLEVERAFGEASHFALRVKASEAETLSRALVEATAGRATVTLEK